MFSNRNILTLCFLFTTLFVAASGECFSTSATYALCRVNESVPVVVSVNFTGQYLSGECHGHFITDSFDTSCTTQKPDTTTDDHDHDHDHGPTRAQSYGYGFLAVFIICCLSLVGILALPCIKKSIFPYVLVFFTALAVGTLFSDSMFHLIPFAFGLHVHEGEGGHDDHDHSRSSRADEHDHSETVPLYQWRAFVAVMVLYSFYLLEVALHVFAHRVAQRSGSFSTSHGHSHGISMGSSANRNSKKKSSISVISKVNGIELNEYSETASQYVGEKRSPSARSKNSHSDTTESSDEHTVHMSTGWMVIIGDAIHNFADGLAIGAAFSQSLLVGLTTTIAVGCHELPHELGDYAVLLQAGFSRCWALFWNFISSLTALIGLFVGVAVSTNENARQWILAITAGMFLYIALVDLLPTLLPHGSINWKRFACVNAGFLIGVLIMFLLAIYEEKLIDSVE